ncbi:MAG: CBS domain-containing protein [Clostridia bacterium]|nr:CBS domain-containing protein [Clostridia bacterium]
MNLMNVFTPKSEVICLSDTYTLRQVMEKMEQQRYMGLPMLDAESHYVGTVTEGDLLWYCKSHNFSSLRDAERVSIREIPLHVHTAPVSVNTPTDTLIDALLHSNFVPVEDDRGCFIGIVTRKKLISAVLSEHGISDTSSDPLSKL